MAAPPSSPNDVLEALAHALSPDPSSRKHAADLLAQWALLPGYYSHLVNAIHAREHVPAQIRQQAAIQLKNGVDRYWRRGALQSVVSLSPAAGHIDHRAQGTYRRAMRAAPTRRASLTPSPHPPPL